MRHKYMYMLWLVVMVCMFCKEVTAQSGYYDFQNTTYYTASGNTLTSSGTTLATFNYNTAIPSHPLKNNGVYFPVVDYYGRNLWIRVQHTASDPNGTGVGHNVTSTASSPFNAGGFGGWFGFLYQFEMYIDNNLNGTPANLLNGLTNANILVESIETLSSGEWLSMNVINNTNPNSYWILHSINFTGSNPASNPNFSSNSTGPYSATFPTASKDLYTIDGVGGGHSEFQISANVVSQFTYGYEYSSAGGYQGLRFKVGTAPTITLCTSTSVAPTGVTTNDVDNVISSSSSITLTATGGTIGSGGVYRWYDGGCGTGIPVGLGSPLTLVPSSIGLHTYFVRIEDSCGVSSCANVDVTVLNTEIVSDSIVAYQYFFDTDPGVGVVGNGAVVSVSPTTSYIQSLNISTSGLTPGFHRLFMRVQDDAGKWSIAERSLFYVNGEVVSNNIVAQQYFFDTDPGVGVAGNGAVSAVSATTNYSSTQNISATGLAPGYHQLFMRVQDDAGKWSIAERSLFYVVPLLPTNSITAYQYFFDTDPGVGNTGNGAITSITPTTNYNQPLNINISGAGLSNGFHQLFMRTLNTDGVWSIAERNLFFIVNDNNTQTVTALEYYYDTDPGVGNGLPIAVTTGASVSATFPVPAPCLSVGTHYIYARAKDEYNRWSIIDRDTFAVTTGIAPVTITASGPLTFCAPGSVTLNGGLAVVGIGYQWLESGSPVSGATTPTLVATTSGNYSLRFTCGVYNTTSNVLTVVVATPPVISTCASAAPINNTAGQCGAIVSFTAPVVTGTPAPVITYSQNSGTFFPVGTTPVTVTATNLCAAPTCSFNVVVTDTELPVISNCPATINLNNTAGLCSAVATWTAPSASDNCAVQTFTSSHNSGDAFPVGTTIVTYTATDVNGLNSACSFNVVVTDTELPVISNCPATINLNNATGLCSAVATWTAPSASDNCAMQTFASSHNSGDAFPVGTTTVTYTATDIHGLISTCTFNVVVTDVEDPAIAGCPGNINSVTTLVTWTAPTASDNCSIQTFTSSHNPGDIFPVGNTTVIYVATDASGNTDTCTFIVNVCAPSTAPTSITNNAVILNEICLGNNIALTVQGGTLGSGASFKWYKGGCGSGISIGTGTTINVTPVTGGVHQYYVRAEGTCNNTLCVSTSIAVKTAAPISNVAVPSMIGLPVHACNGQVNTISVPAISSASQYIWDGPTGTTFNVGANPYTSATSSASITFGNPNGSGYYIGVQAANACGASVRKSQWVRGTTSVPLAITGNTTVCESTGPFTYTIPSTVGATSYLWTITGDASINGAGASVVTTTLSVNVTYGAAWTGGTLCVASQTPCYTSAFKCLTLSRAASPLTQINGNTIACPGQTLSYLVTPVNGAATYVWTLPPGCTGTSSTNSINVTFGSTFIGGNIKVHVSSVCGVASADVSFTINSGVPARPASITGPTTGLCGQTIVYTCPTQSGVTFAWTVPAGSTINSGQGTNAISVTFGTFGTGTVCVTAGTTCGTSTARCITVKGAPNAPGAISAIPSSWCANTAGIEFGVDVTALSGSYTLSWLYPNATIAQYVLGGGNSTSLIMNWLTGTGPVHVTASNACGNATRTSTQGSSCRESFDYAQDDNLAGNHLTVYPNPTNVLFNVEFMATQNDKCKLQLIDLTGKIVLEQNVNATEGLNNFQIDVKYFAKGLYLLNVSTNKSVYKAKVEVN